MTDIAIRVENLGKQYHIGALQNGGHYSYKSLRDVIAGAASLPFRAARNLVSRNGHRRPEDEIIWALKDVSFEVRRGEIVGVIGRNGAGKSTLLKLLSRITEPTTGRAEIHGRVGSLLEVGTGFHPELTGRDNVFLNGAILGMKRAEIARKFDEIVAFAEVEKFIDTPVKHYSSGMYLRLAFAVAAHLEPEILIVDEVLAVGDAEFQKKCLGKMQDVSKREGRTVIFVSHNMGAVSTLCSRALWLDAGALHQAGPSRTVIDAYLSRNPSTAPVIDLSLIPRPKGDQRLRIQTLIWTTDMPPRHGKNLKGRIKLLAKSPIDQISVGIGFSTPEGIRLLTYESDYSSRSRASIETPGIYDFEFEIDDLPLMPAIYSLDIGCRSGDNYSLDYLPNFAQMEVIPGPTTPGYIVRNEQGVRLGSNWTSTTATGIRDQLELGIGQRR